MKDESLLTPSLNDSKGSIKLFSEQALLIVAFFGGVFAVIIMSALNSLKLRRLQKDLPLYLVISTIYCVFMFYYLRYYSVHPDSYNGSNTRLFIRLISVGVWAILFAVHKKTHRVNEFRSDSNANPWTVGITCIVASIIINMSLVYLITYIIQS